MLNVTCARSVLHEAVQIVSRGVTGRSTQPVQNNIYLESGANQLRLVATDLEFISMEALVDVTVAEDGAITAPARLLSEVIGTLPEGNVTLAGGDHEALSVTCGRSHYTIRGLPANDFQMLSPVDEGLRMSLPQSQLHTLLRQTVFSTSKDETRPILTGALFEFAEGAMKIVATDTYRLALRKVKVEYASQEPVSAIVSARALGELLRVLSEDAQDPVNMALSGSQVEFEVGNVKVGSRLIEGQFPNYEKVIPSGHERRMIVPSAELEPALRRALIVAREDANRVVLRPSGDVLQITAESPDVGRVEEEVPMRLEGEPTEIAFNARYLLEVVEALETEDITLDLAGPLNPGMIRGGDSEDYLYVLMPMQIM